MTPDEQRLIEDLFDRLSAQGRPTKDRGADALIQNLMRTNPDAAYMLVQSAIVYQYQIADNERRIQDLEDQLASAEPQSGGGSFLGGLFGGGGRPPVQAPSARGPVAPRAEARRAPAAAAASPWSQSGAAGQSPPQRGSFLGSALATAAGVAGGMMVADSLRGMFGGAAGDTASAGKADTTSAATDQNADNSAVQDADTSDYDTGGDFDGGSFDV